MDSAPRRPWLATLLGLVCSGLGHLYAGRLATAVAMQAVATALAVAATAALRAGPGATLAIVAASSAFWIGQAVHAGRTARRAAPEPRRRSSHPVALLGFFAASSVLSSAVTPILRERIAHPVYVPSGAMLPTIEIGDYLLVASGRPPVLRGAVVVHAAPVGWPRPDPLLKRVVAVGGDTVEIRDGALWVNDAPVAREPVAGSCSYASRPDGGAWREDSCLEFAETLDGRAYRTFCTPYVPCGDVERQIVPAGYVWVAGDHRDHSADSRVYGPIPERMILGEVRWVIASWGPTGPRWSRFGDAIR